MKKEFVEVVTDIAPIIFSVSIASSFLKGARTVTEYLKALIASYVLGIPGAFLVEYFFTDPNAWMLKYIAVLTIGAFGICLFNGIFKIFKKFEQDPVKTIKTIRKGQDD